MATPPLVYNFVKELGKGSFGSVLLGCDQYNRFYAIKRINRKMIQSNDYLFKSFQKEIEIMKICKSNYSVQLYEQRESVNYYNLIMELCDDDLENVLMKQIYPFNTEKIRIILEQLNDVFAILYREKIMHRDLKLKNIFIKYTNKQTNDFDVKLGDFGFSKICKEGVTNTILGTPITMAPEIMKGEPYSFKADLWSVGVIVYQLYTKEYPYFGNSINEILAAVYSGPPRIIPSDPLLRDLLSKLLEIDKNKRLSWEEYFNHPFFHKRPNDMKNVTMNVNNTPLNAYTNAYGVKPQIKSHEQNFISLLKVEREIHFGFNNSETLIQPYKCMIMKNEENGKTYLVKQFTNDFILKYKHQYEKELFLYQKFNKCNISLNYISFHQTPTHTYLLFENIDKNNVALVDYLKNNDIDENSIKGQLHQLLFEVFVPLEQSNYPLDIITLYTFMINVQTKKLFFFDFGLHRCLLTNTQIEQYSLINNFCNNMNIKSNVINFGITLYKIYFKETPILEKDQKFIQLPNKESSIGFQDLLSKCLYKNENKRNTFTELLQHDYVNNSSKKGVILNEEQVDTLIESIKTKYHILCDYYNRINLKELEYKKEFECLLASSFLEMFVLNKILESLEHDTNYQEQIITLFKFQDNSLLFPDCYKCLILNLEKLSTNYQIIPEKSKEIIKKFKDELIKFENQICDALQKLLNFSGKTISNDNIEECKNLIEERFRNERMTKYLKDCLKRGEELKELGKICESKREFSLAKYIVEMIITLRLHALDEGEEIHSIQQMYDNFRSEDDRNKLLVSTTELKKNKKEFLYFSFLGRMFGERLKKENIQLEGNNFKKIQFELITLGGMIQSYPKYVINSLE